MEPESPSPYPQVPAICPYPETTPSSPQDPLTSNFLKIHLNIILPPNLNIVHLLKSSTCFEHYTANFQEVYVVIVYMQPLVSSVSAGDCLVHRLRKNLSSILTGAQDSHLQRVTIPEATCIQLRRRPPEDEQGSARNM
jgi:hypothetical protein